MSNPPEGQSNTNDPHEKNRVGLEITKQKLQEELNSIIDLIGLGKKDSSFANSSNSQPQAQISQKNFSSLLEANKKLQTDVTTLSDSIENLKNEINTLRENIRILVAEQPNISLIENQILDLKEAVRNLENTDLPQAEDIVKEKVEDTYANNEAIIAESNVQNESELSIEEISKNTEKIIQETHRRRCPTCNNGNQRYIRELVDKSNVINYSPRIFGKKFKCTICTTEWK